MAFIIKKYANRKLHLEGTVKYLSMLELSDLAVKALSAGESLKVICDRTGRDLTLETLSRSLYERLKRYFNEDRFVETKRNKPSPFPSEDLMGLIASVPGTRISSGAKS